MTSVGCGSQRSPAAGGVPNGPGRESPEDPKVPWGGGEQWTRDYSRSVDCRIFSRIFPGVLTIELQPSPTVVIQARCKFTSRSSTVGIGSYREHPRNLFSRYSFEIFLKRMSSFQCIAPEGGVLQHRDPATPQFIHEWIADSNKPGHWNRWACYIVPVRYGVRVNAPTEVWWYGSWGW